MSPLKKAFYRFSSFFPTSFLQAVSPVGTLFPYHHLVSDEKLEHVRHLYPYKNIKQFEDDLDALLKFNSPITLSQLTECIQSNKPFPKKTFLLSFDDGFREIFEVVAPILKRKGLPAVFFINPEFVDNKTLFYRCKISLLIGQLKQSPKDVGRWGDLLNQSNATVASIETQLKKVNQHNSGILDEIAENIGYSFQDYLLQQRPFLTTEQIKILHKDGFIIGGHSMQHPYYQLLPIEEQLAQTLDSVKFVNTLLDIDSAPFSFPHSDADLSQELFNQLKTTDIPAFFGTQNQKEEKKNRMLHRFNAERPAVLMKDQVKGLHLMVWMKHLAGTNHVQR